MAHRRASISRISGLSMAAALAVAAIAVGAAPATAAPAPQTRYVAVDGKNAGNNCLDEQDPCKTIQRGVDVAKKGDTVQVGAGTYKATAFVDTSVTIVGESAATTTVKGTAGMAFMINTTGALPRPTVTLKGMTITTVKVHQDPDEPGGVLGIGVLNNNSKLTIQDSIVENNLGGGLFTAGGPVQITGSTFRNDNVGVFQLGGSVAIADSLIADNLVPDDEFGVFGSPAGFGVALFGGKSLTIDRSVISGNDFGVAVSPFENGGGKLPTATISRSTLSGNSLAGLSSAAAKTTVDTSTVSGNSFTGIVSEDAASGSHGSIVVKNSTVSDTKFLKKKDVPEGVDLPVLQQAGIATVAEEPPTFGPLERGAKAPSSWIARLMPTVPDVSALHVPEAPAASPTVAPAGLQNADARPAAIALAAVAAPKDTSVHVSGTIITTTDPKVRDCSNEFADGGYNLSSDAKNSCAFGAKKHNLRKTDAMLGALSANGGIGQTQIPAAGSPAIDAIPAGEAGCTDGATDERGTARPQGDACDIGAVEVVAAVVTDPPTTAPPTTDPATTDPATTDPATTAPATTSPAGTTGATTAAPGGSAATDAGALPRTGATAGPAIPVGIGALLIGGLLVGATAFNRRRNAKH